MKTCNMTKGELINAIKARGSNLNRTYLRTLYWEKLWEIYARMART